MANELGQAIGGGQATPTPAPAPATSGRNTANAKSWYDTFNQWRQDPENAMAILQGGLSLLAGAGSGRSTAQAIGQAIGAGAEYKGRVAQARAAQAGAQRERDVEDRELGQKDRELDIKEEEAKRRGKGTQVDTDKRVKTIRESVESLYPELDPYNFDTIEEYRKEKARTDKLREQKFRDALQANGIDPAAYGLAAEPEGLAPLPITEQDFADVVREGKEQDLIAMFPGREKEILRGLQAAAEAQNARRRGTAERDNPYLPKEKEQKTPLNEKAAQAQYDRIKRILEKSEGKLAAGTAKTQLKVLRQAAETLGLEEDQTYIQMEYALRVMAGEE